MKRWEKSAISDAPQKLRPYCAIEIRLLLLLFITGRVRYNTEIRLAWFGHVSRMEGNKIPAKTSDMYSYVHSRCTKQRTSMQGHGSRTEQHELGAAWSNQHRRKQKWMETPYLDLIVATQLYGREEEEVWDIIARVVTSAPTLAVFRNRRKTYLFSRSFTRWLTTYSWSVWQFLLRLLKPL